jgi:MFS transporter, putative metabolite:H+ symporter
MTAIAPTGEALRLETVVGRMERLPFSRIHKKVFALTTAGYMFDAFDIGLLSFVMPGLAADLHLSPGQIGLVFTCTFLGMFIGTLSAGNIADRFGRLKVFQYTLLTFAIATGLTGFVKSFEALLVLRFITGLGLGGEQPVSYTYLSEMVPHAYRGRLAGLCQTAWGCGMILAGGVAYLLVPKFGWQSAFFVGVLPACLVWFFRFGMPESPRWFMICNRPKDAEAELRLIEEDVERSTGKKLPPPEIYQPVHVEKVANYGVLFQPKFRRRTVMLWLMWFFLMFGNWGVEAWIPTLLKQSGYTLSASIGTFFLMNCVRVPSGLFGSFLSDKLGRRKPILFYFGLAGCAVLAYGWVIGQHMPPEMVLLCGCAVFLFLGGGQPIMYAYSPENYPTEVRATGTGTANSIGRIGAMLAPAVVGFLLPVIGPFNVFAVIASALLAGGLAVFLLGTETRGKTLEAISNGGEEEPVVNPALG